MSNGDSIIWFWPHYVYRKDSIEFQLGEFGGGDGVDMESAFGSPAADAVGPGRASVVGRTQICTIRLNN